MAEIFPDGCPACRSLKAFIVDSKRFALLSLFDQDRPDGTKGMSVWNAHCGDCGYVMLFNDAIANLTSWRKR
jgi:hypothetical protein